MWAACDLAMYIINQKAGVCDTRDFSAKIHLPEMYFKPMEKSFVNTKIYIPLDIYTIALGSKSTINTTKKTTSGASTAVTAAAKRAADNMTLNEVSPRNSHVS